MWHKKTWGIQTNTHTHKMKKKTDVKLSCFLLIESLWFIALLFYSCIIPNDLYSKYAHFNGVKEHENCDERNTYGRIRCLEHLKLDWCWKLKDFTSSMKFRTKNLHSLTLADLCSLSGSKFVFFIWLVVCEIVLNISKYFFFYQLSGISCW